MKRILSCAVAVFTAFALLCVLFGVAGCSQDEQSWELADGITASFSDDGGYGYILTVEGSGAMPDYSSESQTPWYGRAGRVTSIEIGDGITYIGDYTFAGCAYVDYVILPQSVTGIGSNSFNSNIMICSYGAVTTSDGATVYLYSEGLPSGSGMYWHYVLGTPFVWINSVITDELKVLFIGNSFTYYNDLPSLFAEVANGAGADVEVDSVTAGAYNLVSFASETDEYGAQVAQKLAENEYDIVILQEQSTRPITSYSLFLQGATSLIEKINATQESCDVYLYQTWGYPSAITGSGNYADIPTMEAALRTAYENCASATGATVAYVGRAFTYVYSNYADINLYNEDNQHPSYEGSYLAACVLAATIMGCDPTGTTFTGSLDQSVAVILQAAAYSVVYG